MLMSSAELEKSCKENGGYRQPRLNDQLFLQCKGFCEMADSLAAYTEVKALWLEQNAISKIEHVSHMSKLASLFLQSNVIRSLGSGLSGLRNLRTLNLSHNYLASLDGILECPLLETLQVSHNRLECLEDLAILAKLPELSSLDVSHNCIDVPRVTTTAAAASVEPNNRDDAAALVLAAAEDPIEAEFQARVQNNKVDPLYAVHFFRQFPALTVIYLHGQELPRRLKNYRKTMVAHLPNLAYLDERPVFPNERRTADAWLRGGVEEEKVELAAIRQEKEHELAECLRTQEQYKTPEAMARRAEREREWQAEQEALREWRAEKKVEFIRRFTELETDEAEGRYLLTEEAEAAARQEVQMLTEASLLVVREAEAKRAVEDAARRELDAREAEIANEAERERAARQATFDEMQFWVKKFAEDDAATENGLQAELEALIQQLKPGPAPAPTNQGEQHSDPTAVVPILPTADGASTPAASSAVGGGGSSQVNPSSATNSVMGERSSATARRKGKKEARWAASAERYERFYQMERKFLSRSTPSTPKS